MKIAIMGYSGAGKSTLARELGGRLGLPVLHLDSVNFLPGWQERERAESCRIVRDFMADNAGWIIEGNYSNLEWERRQAEAERIVLLLFGRLACLRRVVGRYRRWRGRSRPDICEGCEEKLDADFVLWVLFRGRIRRRREGFEGIARRYPEKTVVLRNQRELDRFRREAERGVI